MLHFFGARKACPPMLMVLESDVGPLSLRRLDTTVATFNPAIGLEEQSKIMVPALMHS